MSITSTGATNVLNSATDTASGNPKGILGKDDFLKLLLVQLQYQDPTAPTDTAEILSQTSQLASLESVQNTNEALKKLTESLGASQQFSTISAIGKTADLGSDSIAYEEGTTSTFEVYFPNSIQDGTVNIKDSSGNVVKTLEVATNPSGVYQFSWDGVTLGGNNAKSATYKVTASYNDKDGNAQKTKLGAYPIESVRFDGGEVLVKLGSSYVPLASIKEVY